MEDIFVRNANLGFLMKKTGYNITQENGQRKFGPPSGWIGPLPPKGSEIFLYQLPSDAYEVELVPLCQQFGRIYELRLMMEYTGENRGYAFLTYTNNDDATKAIKHLDDYEIRPGRHIGVCKSVDSCRLFVGGIPKEKSKEEIMLEISKFTNEVSNVITYMGFLEKFVFVDYHDHRAAAIAMYILKSIKQLFSHDIVVDWCEDSTKQDCHFIRTPPNPTTNEMMISVARGEYLIYPNIIWRIENYRVVHTKDSEPMIMLGCMFHLEYRKILYGDGVVKVLLDLVWHKIPRHMIGKNIMYQMCLLCEKARFKSSYQYKLDVKIWRIFKTKLSRVEEANKDNPDLIFNINLYGDGSYKDSMDKMVIQGQMVDQGTLDKLDAGFQKLQAASDCKSLLKKYLTKEVLDTCKTKKTQLGATLLDCIQPGFEIFNSGVGICAPDAEAYTLFAPIFNPIIEDCHEGFKPTDKHPATDFGDINTIVNVDPTGKFVVSTRVRCIRSLKGYAFNPCLTKANYKELEDKVSNVFNTFEGELKGKYYPLTGMDKATQQQLIDDHILFKEGDRFLQAANACRYWPTGRGIYYNDSKTFLIWVNYEDHMRIISMQKGGDLKDVFQRLINAVNHIEGKLSFSRDDRLGYLTFCPTNLGTTIRASVIIALPKLAKDKKVLEDIAAKFNLQVRGTRGEHTESEGGVYDISNKRRMGLTEYQAVKEMQDGILEMIKMEEAAA